MILEEYISKINQRFQLGNSTEHTFRGDLQTLLESIVPKVSATNEPKRIACGAPDYVLTKKDIPVGFIEAKDIGDKDLEGKKKTGNKSQFDRYKNSLDNLAFTDYLDFHFYQEKKFVKSIAIGKIENGQIEPIRENFESFERHINDFCIYEGQTIKSPKKLAEMMAAKAQLLAEVIESSLNSDEKERQNSSLNEQFEAFKQILIKGISHKAFADVYAQTIAYGMFAARLHDDSPTSFTRQRAAVLIPKSNPFLRKLFQYIAGYDLDERLVWIVDSLADIFSHANVEAALEEYGRETQTEDALIHFYETFLAEYDPKLRKSRGVWYTPKPVVNFIVRAVDDILKTEFNLSKGLTDSSKTKIKVSEKGDLVEKEVHKVQILDPATGTGTFLAETVEHIYKQFQNQKGVWNSYVENDLLPRLNGFELLMASYAMAHLKLDFLLKETGFKPTSESNKQERFRIFLTNSLEEGSTELESSFANWLSTEANEANKIKKDTPVMVILGNPPYSGESQNKGKWIMELMEDYKKEPEGKVKLKERNPKWINDDYVKFLRYGQHFIEKNESGILAFINPHGFLDNPTFRGMRWNLLKTYDKIYTIDLHGNSKKKEVSPDGSIDQNVFDIQQGVSINIFVKTGKKKKDELGQVFHYDLYGRREHKYDFLDNHSLKDISFTKLPNVAPNYFMVQKDFEAQAEYDKGFSVNELFVINSVGIVSGKDAVLINYNHKDLTTNIESVYHSSPEHELIRNIDYRPFDTRSIYYDTDLIERAREKVMQHFINDKNIGLTLPKINKENDEIGYTNSFITKNIIDARISDRFITSIFPLYLYPEKEKPKKLSEERRTILYLQWEEKRASLETMKKAFAALTQMYEIKNGNHKEAQKIYKKQKKEYDKLKEEVEKLTNALEMKEATNGTLYEAQEEPRKPNLKKEIVAQIAQKLGLVFTVEKTKKKGTFAPIDILDYIYAVLHSPKYREKYKEFLKIDFPRVPYPTDAKTFWKLVDLGGQIRQIHLLESDVVDNFITSYPISSNEGGENEVEQRPKYALNKKTDLGKVYINETQYFDNVPKIAWEFYIGGYQPAQKWLKDRKGRKLTFEDINHYQKIIVALSETDRLMKEIDTILF
ncbi:type ISP restriction/modification enzyme [Bernardetia sp. ABR2-2B]|uniref:type ISP restriction/modification enzyme n=1 Tax=Bernardetia sp. ABR2-2B TaxID=3127472 RepID=UPI0030D62119